MSKGLVIICLLVDFTQSLKVNDIDSEPDSKPKFAKLGKASDIETFWQRPKGEIKGTLFVAHGAMHQGTDFFAEEGKDGFKLEGCQKTVTGKCLGLPEEMELRRIARERGYLVVSVTGGRRLNRNHSSWDIHEDVEKVKEALAHVRKEENVESLPVFLAGASAGGHFVGALAKAAVPNLKCVSSQVSGLGVDSRYPKDVLTHFVHMPRDTTTAARVQRSIDKLKKMGATVTVDEVNPSALTEEFLTKNGFGLTPSAAVAAIKAFRHDGIIDDKGFITENPRRSAWRKAVKTVEEMDSLVLDESKLSELMNVAYAQHEITSQHAAKMLDFCETAK